MLALHRITGGTGCVVSGHHELKVSKGRAGESWLAGWLAGVGDRGVINKRLRALDTKGA